MSLDLPGRIAKAFGQLVRPGPAELASAWHEVAAALPEVMEFAGEPGVYPYGRRVIFVNDEVELVVMNWASGRTCAPHDHGASFGWINVLSGQIAHTLYTLDQKDVPIPYLNRTEMGGTTYFAPRYMIHDMGNPTDEVTITVHVYAPPVTGMKVYDLQKCVACVVSDDCGAWWPAEQRQLLEVLRLDPGRRAPAGPRPTAP